MNAAVATLRIPENVLAQFNLDGRHRGADFLFDLRNGERSDPDSLFIEVCQIGRFEATEQRVKLRGFCHAVQRALERAAVVT